MRLFFQRDEGPPGRLVATTGLAVDFDAETGRLDFTALLPRPRLVASLTGPGRLLTEDLRKDGEDLDIAFEAADLRLGIEARVRVEAKARLSLALDPALRAGHRLDRRQKSGSERRHFSVRADAEGGLVLRSPRALLEDRVVLEAGEILELEFFSPRPPRSDHATLRIAHEGRPWEPLPSPERLELLAPHADLLTLHAYFWREEDARRRPLFSRYRFRPNPWRNARHEPLDPEALCKLLQEARARDLRVLAYLSPRYSAAPDMLAEIERVQDQWNFDGYYLDGLRGDAEERLRFMRALRSRLGEESILYLNASDGPFSDPAVPSPAIETWADFVLRGDSGRGGLSKATFLREALSGWRRSNAVGVWCHYGSSCGSIPWDRRPPKADIEAALAAHVRLWRRSFWRDPARFDALYEPGLAELARREQLELEVSAARR